MSSELAAPRAGAVGDPPRPLRQPVGEQRALAAGEAIVDLSDRDVLSVTGPRPAQLARLAHLAEPRPASRRASPPRPCCSTRAAASSTRRASSTTASPPGCCSTPARARACSPSSTGCGSCSASRSPTARPSSRPSARSARRCPASPRRRPTASRSSGATRGRRSSPAGTSTRSTAAHPAADWNYSETLVERSRLGELLALPAAGTLALEALRIAAWRPRAATEVDATTIPHELDWLRSAVHLTKGCYRGQETVAKVHNLGHPPRRLVMLHLDGSDGVLPAAGRRRLVGRRPSSGASPPPPCTTSSGRSRSP